MLFRSSTFTLKNGYSIQLPRLIPSFTSKGFPKYEDDGKTRSAANNVLKILGPNIKDSILISAYDIYKHYFQNPMSYFGNKELVIIDSGGYELTDYIDSTEPKVFSHNPDETYTIKEYESVLNNLNKNQNIIITNFDFTSNDKPLEHQITDAQTFFNKFPAFTNDFIIKPSSNNKLDIDEIIRHSAKLKYFDVIGFTEKELGQDILEIMKNIITLKLDFEKKGVTKPIHIWGGLDPTVTPLYFCAGAELFDGVSWLRYGYYNDTAIQRNAYNVLRFGVHSSWANSEGMRWANNLNYLETLTDRLRKYLAKGGDDYSMFGYIGEFIRNSVETLKTKI